MESSKEYTIENLPLKMLVAILSWIPGMTQIVNLVSKKLSQASSLIKDGQIHCGEYAAQIGSWKLIEWLLAQGYKTKHFCLGTIKEGQWEIVQHLVKEKKFLLNTKIIYQFAIKNDEHELLHWILSYYNDISKNEKLVRYALDGNLGGVIKRLGKGDLFEEKIVGWVAKRGHREVVQWLTVNILIPKFIN